MLEDKSNIFTIGEIAEIFNISTMTLQRWDTLVCSRRFTQSKTNNVDITEKMYLPICNPRQIIERSGF